MGKSNEIEIVNNITSFEGLQTEEEKIDRFCDILESLPFGILIPSRVTPERPYAMGHTKDKIIRIEFKGGLMLHDLTSNSKMEEGYVYKNPSIALAWLACKLGHGTNASNFETNVIVVQPEMSQHHIRIAFEEPLTKSQLDFYKTMGTFGFKISDEKLRTKKFGNSIMSELKQKN